MIVVAGSVNLDLVARVARLPQPGETLAGLSFAMSPGGKGANQALAARRAGSVVSMLGAVGADSNADAALMLLKEAGVHLAGVTTCKNETPTGVALILVDDTSGENEIVVVAGANGTLGASLSADLPDQATTVLLQMEVPAEANRAMLDAAAGTGARTLLNIAPYGDDAVTLAAKADITVANETEFDLLAEAMTLKGDDRRAKAADFVAKTGRAMVITLGADGAFAVTADGAFEGKTPRIEPVDTVGAGDTFCGYLGAALAEGMAMDEALDLACKAGALACLNKGAQSAIPIRKDVDGFKV